MFLAGRPSSHRLERTLVAARAAAPSYREIGATSADVLPDGYGHVRRTVSLGSGRGPFDRASEGLRRWEMHTRSGFAVHPIELSPSMHGTLLVLLRMGPVVAVAPCRIVYVVDEPDRFGFAYGTLPGHPESGEEAFIIDHGADGRVQFTVTAFSRPAEILTRLGGPVTRLVQTRATRSYLRAMQHVAAQV